MTGSYRELLMLYSSLFFYCIRFDYDVRGTVTQDKPLRSLAKKGQ